MRHDVAWPAAGVDPVEGLERFQERLPVDLIQTRRAAFVTCTRGDAFSDVLRRNAGLEFDHWPVVDAGGQVEGVLELAKTGHPRDCTVADCFEPLAERHLIGAGAGILEFVRVADKSPFRFVVDGNQVSGLVTLSDLQQLPVRAALFAQLTHFEMTMIEVIRVLVGADSWPALLSEERAQGAAGRQADAGGHEVEALLYTQFCDKRTIIVKRGLHKASAQGPDFESDLKIIEKKLRDHVVHANDYAWNGDAAREVCRLVRRIDYWTAEMKQWMRTET